jgi:hypothetical protein
MDAFVAWLPALTVVAVSLIVLWAIMTGLSHKKH